MQPRWLLLLVFGIISGVVFLFFFFSSSPVQLPSPENTTETVIKKTTPEVTFVNPRRGAAEPRVTIVEFSDFECPACKQIAEALDIVINTYPNDVAVVWKDLPNESIHLLATPASIAAHCADRQGAFWAYHDGLFEKQSFLSETHFAEIATDIGLDRERFQKCYDSRDTLPIIKNDFQEARALEIPATPTIYINDVRYVGAYSSEEILDLVRKELAPATQ